jgi:hypothetical protein
MTGTNFQWKRSERGASLIMLVSIIGLAFVVTVAGFLVAASYSQDTARLASAKVDVATREDALMREILQQTATGMLPGTDGFTGPILTWTQIMTNAATNLHAISYVDPAELAALPGLAGVIPANMGDTAGTLLGIFQGYNQEVPFGGTSGLLNLVPVNAALAAVEPPLMNWSANATLSSATALTTPQEFFLGSQYTAIAAPVPTALSLSKRWGQIIYPNIRFGYKEPGDSFIARRVWWRIPLVYQTAQQIREYQAGVAGGPASVNLYPSAPAYYVLSVYEIPSQLPISGNANLQIGDNADGTAWGGGVSITGSIYGSQIQLAGGTYSGISSRQAVNVLNPATVGGTPYSNSAFDALGTRETLALTSTPGAAPVSVAGNDGKVLVVPVMPGNEFYMTAPGGPGTETHWDLYARPYYRCRIRILISGTNSTLIYNPNGSPQMTSLATVPTPGAISVNVIVLPDSTNQPDQILGFLDSAGTATAYSQNSYADPAGNLPAWMNYTSTGSTGTTPGRNILIINVGSMVTTLATALGSTPTVLSPQLYSLYVGSNPTSEPLTPATTSDPGVAITGASDLHLFTSGLSIISNQTLYLLDAFNQSATQYATSIFAPDVRYGISGVTPASTTIIGQVSVDQASPLIQALPTPTPGSPLQFLDASGNKISTSTNTFTLSEISNPLPTQMPPITRLTLLFTIERERTN